MAKFNLYASLIIMFIGVFIASAPLVICGFVSVNIWAAVDVVLKAVGKQGGAA